MLRSASFRDSKACDDQDSVVDSAADDDIDYETSGNQSAVFTPLLHQWPFNVAAVAAPCPLPSILVNQRHLEVGDFYYPRMRGGNSFNRVCLCVCASVLFGL